jgi:hypothetical protein
MQKTMALHKNVISDCLLLGLCVSELISCCEKEIACMEKIAALEVKIETYLTSKNSDKLDGDLMIFVEYGKAVLDNIAAKNSYIETLESIKEEHDGALPMMSDVGAIFGLAADSYKIVLDAFEDFKKREIKFPEDRVNWFESGHDHLKSVYDAAVKGFPHIAELKGKEAVTVTVE